MGARDRAKFGAVFCGQIDAGRQRQLIRSAADREHVSAGEVLHQAGAVGEQVKRVFQLESAGEHGGHVFTDAVTDQQGGLDAPRDPELGEGILDGENAWLGERRAVDVMVRGLALVSGWVEGGADVVVEKRPQEQGAFIKRGVENGLGIIDFSTHFHILRALSGEKEGGAE